MQCPTTATSAPEQATSMMQRAPPGANYMARRKVHVLVVMQEMHWYIKGKLLDQGRAPTNNNPSAGAAAF